MSAIKVVQAFSREERSTAPSSPAAAPACAAACASTRCRPPTAPAPTCSSPLGTAAVLWVGAQHVWSGRLTRRRHGRVRQLPGLAVRADQLDRADLRHSSRAPGPACVRVFDDPRRRADRARRHAELARAAARRRSSFATCRFAYPGRRAGAARRRPATSRAGECVAIVGPTGAGKSTLVSLMPRFYDPTAGPGPDRRHRRAHAAAARRCARQISMVLQPPIVFPLSIRENIAYGRPDATRAEVERAARMAQAHDFIARLPQGYDTVDRRAGRDAVGGRAPAPDHRARAAARRADPDPRRAHLVGRRRPPRPRIMDGARAAHARPHDVRHRAPPEHRAPRRPDRGAAAAARSSSAARSTSCCARGGLFHACTRRQFAAGRRIAARRRGRA